MLICSNETKKSIGDPYPPLILKGSPPDLAIAAQGRAGCPSVVEPRVGGVDLSSTSPTVSKQGPSFVHGGEKGIVGVYATPLGIEASFLGFRGTPPTFSSGYDTSCEI